jgi:hypothetical protein
MHLCSRRSHDSLSPAVIVAPSESGRRCGVAVGVGSERVVPWGQEQEAEEGGGLSGGERDEVETAQRERS